jgi:predicted acetyltransferase
MVRGGYRGDGLVGDTLVMAVDVRTLQQRELPAAWAVLSRAFGETPHPDDVDVELALVDPARAYGAEVDGRLVATAASFDLRMAVPGRVAPVAGVTWVGVLPTYRRRGLLGALMERQLTDLHEAGTAVAALWASEGAIYGRYGYGAAAWNLSLGVRRGAAFRLPVPPGDLDLVEPQADLLAAAYERVAAVTPGFPARDERWWAYRLHDPVHARDGATELQCVVTDGGYALYAVQGRWQDGLPSGVVHVRELVAEHLPARLRLWRHLLDLDLTGEVRARAVAPDDPLLLSALAEPRAAGARVRDSLWVRLVDLPDALRSRTYASDVDVVLEVVDERAPWNTGRWRLTGDREDAACLRTQAAADLVLRPEDLGAAYLGGTPLRARPVEERTRGALDLVSTAFGPLGASPWCPLVF